MRNKKIKVIAVVSLLAISFWSGGLLVNNVYASDIQMDEKAKGVVSIETIGKYEIYIPDEVTPFSRITVKKEGGTWRYGTYLSESKNYKIAYSEYMHPNKQSRTTVTLDGKIGTSGWKNRNIWAKSEVIGRINRTAYAYYDVR
ncbi:MAG: lactococcin 972 family bacteriocin [Lachnospiraceae bacterium]|nr:lactococcin 972 family bacteriocin [Lachnospiraceae bacterium]